MNVKVSAELPLPAVVYFVERDTLAFRSLMAKMLNLGGLMCFEDRWTEGDGVEVRKLVTRPDINKYVPKHLRKYLPDGTIAYTDILRYPNLEAAVPPYHVTVETIPPLFAHKASLSFSLSILERSATGCQQILDGTLDFKIRVMGHLVEHIVADNLARVYRVLPSIVHRWSELRVELLAAPGGLEKLLEGHPFGDNDDVMRVYYRSLGLVAPAELPGGAREESGRMVEGDIFFDAVDDWESTTSRIPLEVSRPAPSASSLKRQDLHGAAQSEQPVSGVVVQSCEDERAPDPETASMLAKDDMEAEEWLTNSVGARGKAQRTIRITRSYSDEHVIIGHEQFGWQGGPTDEGKDQQGRSGFDVSGDWADYFEKRGVKAVKAVPNLAARLVNLLQTGVGWGLIRRHDSQLSTQAATPSHVDVPEGQPSQANQASVAAIPSPPKSQSRRKRHHRLTSCFSRVKVK